MKTIIKIAKTELQVLFFSPVAWLILVIFALQTSIVYADVYEFYVRRTVLGVSTNNVTYSVFNNLVRGFFVNIQGYLYLYIPLLTMGVISREFNSGSIKLLYSSPIKSYQIVFGKYLALLVFAFLLTSVLGIFAVHSFITIENVDYPVVLCALFGLFLLVCAYAAVGLFMSAITSYTVVAAMGTLAILAGLNLAKGLWQDIAFVRDITYWMAISGRSNTFIAGLITSEDVLYFLMVVCLFVSFTVIKLQVERKKTSFLTTFSKYAFVSVLVALVGYFSSMPRFKAYYDTSYSKVNTLTEGSQKVVEKLNEPVTIHTYVNMLEENYSFGLPTNYKREVERFEKYLRFKPDMKVKQHLYYHRAEFPYLSERFPELTDQERMDTLRKLNNWKFDVVPYETIEENVDLSGENYRFVYMLETESGRRTFLRIYNDPQKHPSESEISAAFKRLVMDLPQVGFVSGHGERQSDSQKDRGYNMVAEEKTFRYALINQGFGFEDVSLTKEVSPAIRILVIAEPRQFMSPVELDNLQKYIDKGGNLIIAGEPGMTDFVNPIAQQFGVEFLPGTLVSPKKDAQPDLFFLKPTTEGEEFNFHLKAMRQHRYDLALNGVAPLRFTPLNDFESTTLFRTSAEGTWSELQTTNFIDEVPTLDVESGEMEQALPAVLALSRRINDKEQKILVTGDADWLSNGELGLKRDKIRSSSFYLMRAAFYWLSDGEVPIDMRLEPSIDNKLRFAGAWDITKIVLKWVIPGLLILSGVLIMLRRRAR